MEQVGFVKKINKDNAELEVRRSSGCGSCNGCAGGCEVKMHIITIKNTIDAKVGDFVELKGEPSSILRYMFIIYMIPFAFLIAGIVLGDRYFKAMGNSNYELLSFGTGILFLIVSFFLVRIIDKKVAKSNKETIKMTRVL